MDVLTLLAVVGLLVLGRPVRSRRSRPVVPAHRHDAPRSRPGRCRHRARTWAVAGYEW